MAEKLYERYGKKYLPSRVFASGKSEFFGSWHSIPVSPISELKTLDITNTYLVINSVYIREMEAFVRSLGFRDYYFYLWDRNCYLIDDPEVALKQLNLETRIKK